MPLIGVAGWPVAHSRSPALHSAAFSALGLTAWRSQLLPIPPELFAETVKALPDSGFVGINVTIPHKEAALALADEASEVARTCGAANTLTFAGGRIGADNTDAPAIESLIRELLDDPEESSVLLLGAGGSARAALFAALRAGVGSVRVWNRTPERAEALCSELGGEPSTEGGAADLLINTTAVGLGADPEAEMAELPFGTAEIELFPKVIDLVYRGGGTPLANAATTAGCEVADGLEVLVRQGALSLESWTGKAPPLAPLRAAVAD
ncbi:MAG: shikimate dehydrogenase [Actinomycetes bacterium]